MSKDLHTLAGAYVMDALDDEEREAFEAHIAASPATAAEVRSLREAVALLGTAAAESPPPSLRDAVMGEIDTVRQERPVVAPLERPADRQHPSGVPRQAGVQRSRWATRATLGLAAAAVAVSVALGSTLVNVSNRLDRIEQTNAEVSSVLVAEDAVRYEAGLPDGGLITALISEEHSSAVTVAEDLPGLDEERMWALWGFVDGLPVPIGELVNGQPLTIRSAGLDGLGVTVEPRGELTLPTGAVQATLGA